jgi:hypothetical protein
MLIDCQTCPVRDVHCADCMVTALTDLPVGTPAAATRGLPLDRAERRAVSVLLAAGLVTADAAHAARAEPDEDLGGLRPVRAGRTAV